jgi:hypothetical protein
LAGKAKMKDEAGAAMPTASCTGALAARVRHSVAVMKAHTSVAAVIQRFTVTPRRYS